MSNFTLGMLGVTMLCTAIGALVAWIYSAMYHQRWLRSLAAMYHLIEQGSPMCGHKDKDGNYCPYLKEDHPMPPGVYMTSMAPFRTDSYRTPHTPLDHTYIPAILVYPETLTAYPVWERSGPPPPPPFPLFPDDDILDRINRKVR